MERLVSRNLSPTVEDQQKLWGFIYLFRQRFAFWTLVSSCTFKLFVYYLSFPSFKTLWWQINLRDNLAIVTPSEGGSITVSHAGIKLQQGPWTLLLKHLPYRKELQNLSYVHMALNQFSAGWKFVFLVDLFTRNHLSCSKIQSSMWTVQKSVWSNFSASWKVFFIAMWT